MKQRAFLVDISNYQGDMKKYRIVGLLFEMILKGISQRGDNPISKNLDSDMEGEGIVEVVDQFHEAFFDLQGFTIEGLAKLDTRLFMNIRGLEISVWTTTDEVYTIFVALTYNQVVRVVSRLKDQDPETYSKSPEGIQLFNELCEVEYSMIFPAFAAIKSKLNNEN